MIGLFEGRGKNLGKDLGIYFKKRELDRRGLTEDEKGSSWRTNFFLLQTSLVSKSKSVHFTYCSWTQAGSN